MQRLGPLQPSFERTPSRPAERAVGVRGSGGLPRHALVHGLAIWHGLVVAVEGWRIGFGFGPGRL